MPKNDDPEAGGNKVQADDGRDERGRLPEPLDAAHWPPVEGGPAIILPGMAPGQPAGTGPVLSSPVDDEETGALDVDESRAAQGVGDPAGNDETTKGGLRHGGPNDPTTPPARKTPPAEPADPTGTAKTTTVKKG
jgi:hypothetical protein